jgi:CheY-like chemotaxis protein/HPt (histidine-containing phosphotransfer) domain-containing protein
MNQSERERYPILIVDDHPANRQALAFLLKGMGLESELAARGDEAVEYAKNKNWGVILMDIMMPGMDGYEATALIRKYEFTKRVHTPIVAVTAIDLPDARAKCLEAGMDDFIQKPISRHELRECLEHWLQQPIPQLLAEFKSSLEQAYAKDDPINRERLKLLYGTDRIGDILTVFLTATDALLIELKSAINHKNQPEAERVAHELKGSSSAISAEQMSALARNLEDSARDGDWQESLRIYAELAIAFVKVQHSLTDRRASA